MSSALTSPALTFAAEAPADAPVLEALLDRAFGPGRFAKTSERVRERLSVSAPALSAVARADGAIAGCCRMGRLGVGGAPVLFLGPIAVEPSLQGQGLGERLARWSLDAARAEAWADAVLLIGSPRFFGPLGFLRAPDAVIRPGAFDPVRFLWLPLKDGAAIAGAFRPFPEKC